MDVAEVANLLRTISAQPSVKQLTAIANENARLKEEIRALVQENSGLVSSLQRLGGNLDSAQNRFEENDGKLHAVCKEKEALLADLKVAKLELEANGKKVKELEASFKTKHESTAKELQAKNAELQRLQEFFVELNPVSNSKKNM